MAMNTLQTQKQTYLKTTIISKSKINSKLAFSPNKHPMGSVFSVPQELPTQNQTPKVSAPGLGPGDILGFVAAGLNMTVAAGNFVAGMVKTFVPADNGKGKDVVNTNGSNTPVNNTQVTAGNDLSAAINDCKKNGDVKGLEEQITIAKSQLKSQADIDAITKGPQDSFDTATNNLTSIQGKYAEAQEELSKDKNAEFKAIDDQNKAQYSFNDCKSKSDLADKDVTNLEGQLNGLDPQDKDYDKKKSELEAKLSTAKDAQAKAKEALENAKTILKQTINKADEAKRTRATAEENVKKLNTELGAAKQDLQKATTALNAAKQTQAKAKASNDQLQKKINDATAELEKHTDSTAEKE